MLIIFLIQFPDVNKTYMNTYSIYILNIGVCRTDEKLTSHIGAFVTLCVQGWGGLELYYLGNDRECRLKYEC